MAKKYYVIISLMLLMISILLEVYAADIRYVQHFIRLLSLAFFIVILYEFWRLKIPKWFLVLLTLMCLILTFNDVFVGILTSTQISEKLVVFFLFYGGNEIIGAIVLLTYIWSLFISMGKRN